MNIFNGPGIELIGVQNVYYPNIVLNENRFSFQSMQFISHDNPNTKVASTSVFYLYIRN